MEGPRILAQYRDMKTAAEFVNARLEAHKAGTQDISQDPLVQAAMDAQRQTAEVTARWKERRLESFTPRIPERRKVQGIRRQAD